MRRAITDDEASLVLRLVGNDFIEIDIIEEQLRNCRVEELGDVSILEFFALNSRKLNTTRTVLGAGSLRDVDGVPIVFSLLQRDGYLWRLDISRVDGGRIRGSLNYREVVALGFGRGLSLEEKPRGV